MAQAASSYRSETIGTVGLVGCGLIGGAWAAYLLSRGLRVRAFDPAPGAEQRFRKIVADALADLTRLAPVPDIPANALVCCVTLVDFLNRRRPHPV